MIDSAIESVMDMIDNLGLFSTIRRGALGTGAGLCCEIGPSSPDEVYLDKCQYIFIDLTINGKYSDLETLTKDMNKIHHALTSMKEYTSDIVDITTSTLPQVIGREDDNSWIMASDLVVKVYQGTYVPPVQESNEPEETPETGEE